MHNLCVQVRRICKRNETCFKKSVLGLNYLRFLINFQHPPLPKNATILFFPDGIAAIPFTIKLTLLSLTYAGAVCRLLEP